MLQQYRILACAMLAGGCLMASGCKVFTDGPSAVISDFSPPTPAEEARNVFNVYDADVRRRALSNLAAAPFGSEGPYVRLYRLLIDDPDPTVRAAAVKALGMHGEVEDVTLIVIRLHDTSEMVRWEATNALQKIHNPVAIKQLVAMLGEGEGEDADVRQAAANALGQYATPQVYNALVGALDDTRYGVVRAAEKSLQTLTGQDLGTDGSDWLTWQEKNPGKLFVNQQVYHWQPYTPPRGWTDKAKFWKKSPPPVSPQTPVGLDQE